MRAEPEHGTYARYASRHWKCRCDLCRAANNAYQRKRRAERKAEKVPEHVHGTTSGYTHHHCRCDRCRSAIQEYNRARYVPKPSKREAPPHGTYARYSTKSLRCRCDECRKARNEYQAGQRARMKERKDFTHGTAAGYRDFGCRCAKCRHALQLSRVPKSPHGTLDRYNQGCHCLPCETAQATILKQKAAVLGSMRKKRT